MRFLRADLLHACRALNVAEDAPADLWRSAYRLKARQLHPDLVAQGRRLGIVESKRIHEEWLNLDRAWKWFERWQEADFPRCEAGDPEPTADPDVVAAVGSARDLVRPAAVGLADLAGSLLLKKISTVGADGGSVTDVLGKGLQTVVGEAAAKFRDYVGNLLTPKPK